MTIQHTSYRTFRRLARKHMRARENFAVCMWPTINTIHEVLPDVFNFSETPPCYVIDTSKMISSRYLRRLLPADKYIGAGGVTGLLTEVVQDRNTILRDMNAIWNGTFGTPHDPTSIVPLDSVKKISYSDILEAIEDTPCKLHCTFYDKNYYTTSIVNWLNALSASTEIRRQYTPETYDCDNFAKMASATLSCKYSITGMGDVIDYGAGHAYNVIVDSDLKVHWYEPQTNAFVEIGDDLYQGQDGFILFS